MQRKPRACRVAVEVTCACAGAAQYMFHSATAFNQPVEAWDVGQVNNMQVRRRPLWGLWAPRKPHACRVAAEATCACAGAAQHMFYAASVFNQPVAAWDVGQVTSMQVRRYPIWDKEGSGELLRTHSCSGEHP